MKKNLLLITAFLAITGTAMAITPAEIAKEVYPKTSKAKYDAIEKEVRAYEEPKIIPELRVDTVQNIDIPTIENAITEFVNAYEKIKDENMSTLAADNSKNAIAYEKELRKLEEVIGVEISRPDVVADKNKSENLAKLSGELNEIKEYATPKAKLIAELGKRFTEKNNPHNENDTLLFERTARLINPDSTVTKYIVKNSDSQKTDYTDYILIGTNNMDDIFDENGKGDNALLIKYKNAKKELTDLENDYNEAVKKYNESKAADKTDLEIAVNATKRNLEDGRKKFDIATKRINSVLALAETDIDKFLALDPAKVNDEIERIETVWERLKNEGDMYLNVATTYVYGKDTTTLPDEQINAAARITENAINIENNKRAIARNAQDIKDLRKDHNRGMAQMAAMASVDFGNVKARTVKVGAGIGQHSSETAVAVGVAVTPTDALMVNAKWSTSASSIKKSTLGLGATYEFNF